VDSAAGKQKSPQTDNPVGNAKPARSITNKYDGLSIVELAELIVENSDAAALKELAEKRTPIYHKDKWISLVRFIDQLRQSKKRFKFAFGTSAEVDDITGQAVKILYTRFTNLPGNEGPDCRNRYRELLRQIQVENASAEEHSQLVIERIAQEKLRSLLINQFVHCLKEANREANEFFRRYTWQVDHGKIELLRPVWISTGEFRLWLEENTKDCRLEDQQARKRIQDKIYDEFGRGGRYSLAKAAHLADDPPKLDSPVNILAELTADKKVAELKSLRPSIRALGPVKIRLLVLEILYGLTHDSYRDIETAKNFGLSKAALSRFAGSRWGKGKDLSPPDLWRNVFEVAAGDAKFTEAIVGLGIKGAIEKILGLDTTGEVKGNG